VYPAYTQWFIETGWEDGAIASNEGPSGEATFRFEPSRLYANLSSAMRLPEWSTDAAEEPEWRRFRCALEQHESLHIETARAVAANVVRELSLASAPTPEALKKLYYFVWREGFEWGRREDARLDAYTDHGPLL
jgi:predicted secreted Zn-dependent protease